MNKPVIWISTIGGVLGFPPYEIAEFETEFERLKPYMDQENLDEAKWNFFNYYFEDELGFRTATGYSALWNGMNGEAWDEFNDAMADLCRKKKVHKRLTLQ